VHKIVQLGLTLLFSLIVGCGSNDDRAVVLSSPASAACDAGGPPAVVARTDAGVAGIDDPRCATKPVAIPDHPTAAKQVAIPNVQNVSDMGKNLRSVRAFHGRVYFGYGDLNANTGPIDVASYDPVTKSWAVHLTIQTESVERFVVVGDQLLAPYGDAHGDQSKIEDYAIGTANHQWSAHEVANTFHMMDATERVPGEIYLAGSSYIEPSHQPGSFIWRSIGGGPFTQIFPGDVAAGYVEPAGGPFQSVVSFHGAVYAAAANSIWTWDGAQWTHARAPGDLDDPLLFDLFLHPVVIADHIVFGAFGGDLWKYDGKHSTRLPFHTFDTPTAMGFTELPIVIFEESEGRLLTVDDSGNVLMSTDLVTYQCIGKAPPDVRSVGSMNGIVYFGGSNGHAYAYEHPSW
jgi:hypothetical protein